MTKTLSKIIFLLCLLIGTGSAYAQFKVVGYHPSWAGSAGAIQYSKLTHINYAFALPMSDGNLKPIDNPAMLQQIVSNAHAAGKKVFIAIGGWSDGGTPLNPTFEALASTAAGRTNFVNGAMSLVNTYNLDGVDVDWEYPTTSTSNNYAALMLQLSNTLHGAGKQLSTAVAADNYSGQGIPASVFGYVDHINVMAYDNTSEPNHSSYNFAQSAITYWVSTRGCPKSKVILGVPFYARPSWNGFSVLIANGANPNLDQFGTDYYNGIPTMQSKTQLAWGSAGGIMIWELSQDATGVNSLLSAIDTKVKSLGGTVNQNPTVSFTSPGNGATFTAPASVSISANASDPDGSISKVEFYNGATLLTTKTTAPYSYSWTGVAAGSYIITAKAYDNSTGTASASVSITVNASTGGSCTVATWTVTGIYTPPMTVSYGGHIYQAKWWTQGEQPDTHTGVGLAWQDNGACSNVTVNQNPTVSFTSPGNGATFTAPASVIISAKASDPDGSISKVEFYNGATLLTTKTAAPYSYNWTSVAAGSYTITAKAYDNSTGTASASVSMSVTNATVNQNPTVSFTSPGNATTFTAPASVSISANASDPDGSISKVEFYNGSTLLTTKTAAPYSYSWTGVAAGSYTITAKAYDNSTGTASASVSITVNASTGGSCTVAAWTVTGIYTPPMTVSYGGHIYQAKWWTQGEQPDTHTGVGLAWQDNGPCGSARLAAVSTINTETEKISPNPASGIQNVELNVESLIDGDQTLTIISSNGVIQRNENVSLQNGNNKLSIDISQLHEGIYIIRVGQKAFKFIKQ
ncbi:MAG TPA: Ig-like domain-containing protein [Cytophagaceae bacterium]|nr:Ig-like domain-containing protein [Cytophagaceae bacterium]